MAVVTMNSNKANFQNEAFFQDLNEAFDRLEGEFFDCSVVITGQGSVFSAGLDFDESFSVFGSRDEATITSWFRRYRATNLRVFRHPRPTVAAINGHAYAGGLITALVCDYRVAATGTHQYCLNEVPIGIPMPAVYLELIGYASTIHTASRAALFGETFDGAEALRLGLIHRVVSPDDLVSSAERIAGSIRAQSFAAYAFSKAAVQAPTMDRIERLDDEFDSSIASIVASEESLNSLAARFEAIKGRRPAWARE